ncbi:MAG: YfhO family protein [Bulleidia sp.]|nr:YfhO family protein [Bulleidia sp.]
MDQKKKKRSYLLVCLVTLVLLMILLCLMRIYPFGTRTFLWEDSDQYFAMNHYFSTLPGKNDIFWSWSNVLGGNALTQLAYYSLSPFNFIFILLKNHMILAAHLVTYLKIVAAALSCYTCLEHLYSDTDFSVLRICLAECYAFSGYMMFFGWNASWMDGVILLPLVYLGIQRIMEGKSAGLYTVSIALALISNFYIGYMVCLSSVLFYFHILTEKKNFKGRFKSSVIPYAFASLIGGGVAAFVLIPVYCSLQGMGRSLPLSEILSSLTLTISPSELLSGIFTGQINEMNNNAPMIYVGILPVFANIMYLLEPKASGRNKVRNTILILIYLASFEISALNTAWHGFSSNMWFNYRYSFCLTFVVILTAYESLHALKEQRPSGKTIAMTVAALAILAGLTFFRASAKISRIGFGFDAVTVLIMALSLSFLNDRKKEQRLIAAVTCTGLVLNGCLYLKDYDTLSIDTYEKNRQTVAQADAVIQDDSFYRMEQDFNDGRCDPTLFDYRGISNYASTENQDTLALAKRLGSKQNWVWSYYNGNMSMSSESLLGMKYILTRNLKGKDYAEIGNSDDVRFYRNPYALPLVFPAEMQQDVPEDMNPYEMQNMIWTSIYGTNEPVFLENESISSTEGSVSFHILQDGPVYISIPDEGFATVSLETKEGSRELSYTAFMEGYYAGNGQTGDTVTILASTKDGIAPDLSGIRCYTEDADAIASNAEKTQTEGIEIQEVSSSHLAIDYTGMKETLVSTIPYDEGWKVYDNGEETTAFSNWSGFLAVQLNEGVEHHIALVYRPKGWHTGFIVSLSCCMVLVLYEILLIKRK